MKPIFFIVIFVFFLTSVNFAFAETGVWKFASGKNTGEKGFDATCEKYYPELSASCNVVLAHDGLRITMEGGEKGALACATKEFTNINKQNIVVVRYDLFPENSKHHLFVNEQLVERNTPIVVYSNNFIVDLCLEKTESDKKYNTIWFPSISVSWNHTYLTEDSNIVLRLDEPVYSTYHWDRNKLGPVAHIPLKGYLTADGKAVNGATISFFDNGSELAVKTRTNTTGHFSTYFHSSGSNSYHEITATYSGPYKNMLSTSSNIFAFEIIFLSSSPTPQSPQSPQSPKSSQSQDWIAQILTIIIVLIVGAIIIVVIKNRNKLSTLRKLSQSNIQNKFSKIVKITQYMQNIRIFKRQSQSAPPTGQTVPFHFACPDCSAKLQPPTSPNAGQKCQSCGWKS